MKKLSVKLQKELNKQIEEAFNNCNFEEVLKLNKAGAKLMVVSSEKGKKKIVEKNWIPLSYIFDKNLKVKKLKIRNQNDYLKWLKFVKEERKKIEKFEEIGVMKITTSFSGQGYHYFDNTKLRHLNLFYTTVFKGKRHQGTFFYDTYDEAIENHHNLCILYRKEDVDKP